VIQTADFSFSYSLLPYLFFLETTKQKKKTKPQFLHNALMPAKFSKPGFPPPPLSWGLWSGKMQI